MERILRSIIQVGGTPDVEEALNNWTRFQEFNLELNTEVDQEVVNFLKKFYDTYSSPPDFKIVKEFFQKSDKIDVATRLDEIHGAHPYIRTNFLSLVRSYKDDQDKRNFNQLLRDAAVIADSGKTIQGLNGKKEVLRGVNEASGYLFEGMSKFSRIESGDKLEGVLTDDCDEVLQEYDVISKTNKFTNRNLTGFEPVDEACKGHKSGEYWIHCAFSGELKCVPGDALIYDHTTKKRRNVKEIFESGDLPRVSAAYREATEKRVVFADTSHVVENGVREVFEIKLRSGRKVSATSNHPFLTQRGWVKLEDLHKTDWLAVPRKFGVESVESKYSDAEVAAVGYMIGDGSMNENRLMFSVFSDEIREDFKNILSTLGYEEGFSSPGQTIPHFRDDFDVNGREVAVSFSTSKGGGGKKYTSPLRGLLNDLGLLNKTASEKRIPDSFFGISEKQVGVLLSALWSTDGSIHVGDHPRTDRPCGVSHRNDIRYHTTSEGLAHDVQSILLRIGVQSRVTSYTFDYVGNPYKAFCVSILGNESKKKFLNSVDIVGKRVRQNESNLSVGGDDTERFPTSLIKDGSSCITKGSKRYASQVKPHESVSRFVFDAFAKNDPGLLGFSNGDFFWDQVTSITSRGEEMTYDLSVPEHKSFVVNDVVSHNTTVALNYAYNNAFIYNKNIFYAILEMTYTSLRRQIYVIHSSHGKFVTDWYLEDKRRGLPDDQCYRGIDYRKVRDGELSDFDLERFKKVAQDFKANCKGKLFVWRPEDEVKMSDIKKKSEMFHNKYGCDGLIIDYLGLVQPKHRIQDQLASVNSVVREGRMLALNFGRGRGIPLLSLFQMNRQGKMRADKNDGRYDYSAIAFANQIEKDADVITYTYLNDELRKDGKFYLGNLKNRDNPIFERMVGKILWGSKRMRSMDKPVLKLDDQSIVEGCNSLGLNMEDML